MSRGLAVLAGLGLVALVAGGRRRGPAKPPAEARSCPPAGVRLLLMGDSLAVGLGPPMGKLAAACGTPFVADAFTGAHVTQWTGQRLTSALAASSPTTALISLGGNDMGRTDPANVAGAVDELVGRLRGAGVRPLWISPPPMPFADKAGVRAMWHQTGVDYFDTGSVAPALEPERAPDRIHYSPEGYRQLAQLLWLWTANLPAA